MNFISEDVEMLYNPVVVEVKARIKRVEWDRVMGRGNERGKMPDKDVAS